MQATKRTLAAVLMAGALALGFTMAPIGAGTAAAERILADPDVRCAIHESGGHIEFYLPGEVYYNKYTGNWQRGGRDGEWHVISRVQGTGSGGGVATAAP